jgi:hypothetical protein
MMQSVQSDIVTIVKDERWKKKNTFLFVCQYPMKDTHQALCTKYILPGECIYSDLKSEVMRGQCKVLTVYLIITL